MKITENRRSIIGYILGATGLVLLGLNAFDYFVDSSLNPPPFGVSMLVCILAVILIKKSKE